MRAGPAKFAGPRNRWRGVVAALKPPPRTVALAVGRRVLLPVGRERRRAGQVEDPAVPARHPRRDHRPRGRARVGDEERARRLHQVPGRGNRVPHPPGPMSDPRRAAHRRGRGGLQQGGDRADAARLRGARPARRQRRAAEGSAEEVEGAQADGEDERADDSPQELSGRRVVDGRREQRPRLSSRVSPRGDLRRGRRVPAERGHRRRSDQPRHEARRVLLEPQDRRGLDAARRGRLTYRGALRGRRSPPLLRAVPALRPHGLPAVQRRARRPGRLERSPHAVAQGRTGRRALRVLRDRAAVSSRNRASAR